MTVFVSRKTVLVKAPTEGEFPRKIPPPTVPPMDILSCAKEIIWKEIKIIVARINLVG
jgi:hypothetical protein